MKLSIDLSGPFELYNYSSIAIQLATILTGFPIFGDKKEVVGNLIVNFPSLTVML